MLDMRQIVNTLRTAPSKFYDVEDLNRLECPSCGHRTSYSVARYPASKSKVFAGQLLVKCNRCDMAFVSDEALKLDEYYSEGYAREFMTRRLYTGKFYAPENPFWSLPERPVQKRARFFSNLIEQKIGVPQKALDFGPGEGFFLKEMKAEQKFAVELDVNCQKILREELDVTLVDLGSAKDLDVITAIRSLEHLFYTDLRVTLTNMRKALKPGGLLVIDVPNGFAQLQRFAGGELKTTEQLEPHTLFFSAKSLKQVLLSIGFKIEFSSSRYSSDHEEFSTELSGETLIVMCSTAAH